jgi:hypothetical protein
VYCTFVFDAPSAQQFQILDAIVNAGKTRGALALDYVLGSSHAPFV